MTSRSSVRSPLPRQRRARRRFDEQLGNHDGERSRHVGDDRTGIAVHVDLQLTQRDVRVAGHPHQRRDNLAEGDLLPRVAREDLVDERDGADPSFRFFERASRAEATSRRRACNRSNDEIVCRLFFTRWWTSRIAASLESSSRSIRRRSVTSCKSSAASADLTVLRSAGCSAT